MCYLSFCWKRQFACNVENGAGRSKWGCLVKETIRDAATVVSFFCLIEITNHYSLSYRSVRKGWPNIGEGDIGWETKDSLSYSMIYWGFILLSTILCVVWCYCSLTYVFCSWVLYITFHWSTKCHWPAKVANVWSSLNLFLSMCNYQLWMQILQGSYKVCLQTCKSGFTEFVPKLILMDIQSDVHIWYLIGDCIGTELKS